MRLTMRRAMRMMRRMETPALTDDERRILRAMATTPRQRGSDSRVLRAAGMGQGEALRAAHSARVKLGITATDSLRAAAVALHATGALA